MKLKEHYDWVVIGDSPGALLSAALVSRMGLSVLVLGAFPSILTHVTQQGSASICLDPESNFILGLGNLEKSSGLLQECLNRSGLAAAEAAQILRDDFLPQVLMPSGRIQFDLNDSEFASELQRDWGASCTEQLGLIKALGRAESLVHRYWKQLPDRLTVTKDKRRSSDNPSTEKQLARKLLKLSSRGTRQERSWYRLSSTVSEIATASGVYPLSEFARAFHFSVNGSELGDLRATDLLRSMVLSRSGGGFKGGVTAYRELLLRIARRLGAHLLPGSECRRIFVENGCLVGVQVAQRGNVVGVTGGVLGCSLEHVQDMISYTGSTWLRKLKPTPQPSGWRFTVALLVKEEGIPVGMSRRMIWKEPDAPCLEIEMADTSQYLQSVKNARLIFLRTVLPFESSTLEEAGLRVLSARMVRQLGEVIPFLEKHLVACFPDFRSRNQQTGEMSTAYGFVSTRMIPENLRTISGAGVGSSSGVDGLFLATGEAYPELGSFGSTVAALEASAWISHRSGLSGPLC